ENSHHWSAGLGLTTDSRQGHPATENAAAIAPTARPARVARWGLGPLAAPSRPTAVDPVRGLFSPRLAAARSGVAAADWAFTGANIPYEDRRVIAAHDCLRSRAKAASWRRGIVPFHPISKEQRPIDRGPQLDVQVVVVRAVVARRQDRR